MTNNCVITENNWIAQEHDGKTIYFSEFERSYVSVASIRKRVYVYNAYGGRDDIYKSPLNHR